MSTQIVNFQPNSDGITNGKISTGALSLFLAVSLPLVLVTFTAWYVVAGWERVRQQKLRAAFLDEVKELV
jgi:hypothetical protein